MKTEYAEFDYDELMARAVARWMEEPDHPQPCYHRSDIEETPDGKIIVMLENANGPLVDYEFDPETDKLIEVEGVSND